MGHSRAVWARFRLAVARHGQFRPFVAASSRSTAWCLTEAELQRSHTLRQCDLPQLREAPGGLSSKYCMIGVVVLRWIQREVEASCEVEPKSKADSEHLKVCRGWRNLVKPVHSPLRGQLCLEGRSSISKSQPCSRFRCSFRQKIKTLLDDISSFAARFICRLRQQSIPFPQILPDYPHTRKEKRMSCFVNHSFGMTCYPLEAHLQNFQQRGHCEGPIQQPTPSD